MKKQDNVIPTKHPSSFVNEVQNQFEDPEMVQVLDREFSN